MIRHGIRAALAAAILTAAWPASLCAKTPHSPASAWQSAFRLFQWNLHSGFFKDAWLSPAHRLYLAATPTFIPPAVDAMERAVGTFGASLKKRGGANTGYQRALLGRQSGAVAKAVHLWYRCLARQGIKADELTVAVVWTGHEELWYAAKPSSAHPDVQLVSGWSESHLDIPIDPSSQQRSQAGDYFGSIALNADWGGTANGGNAMGGFNGAFGRTLEQDSYEFGVTLNETFFSPASGVDESVFSAGFMARRMFRVSKTLGWNIGAQALDSFNLTQTTDSSGNTSNATSNTVTLFGMGGLNVYVPPGRIDLTIAIGNGGAYDLLAGYTFFFNAPKPHAPGVSEPSGAQQTETPLSQPPQDNNGGQ